MITEPITEEAVQIVSDAAAVLTAPRDGECLACFVNRQLVEFGCDGTHRFALWYRDQTAPRATALRRNLSAMGACCCDCEILMNAYEPAVRLWKPGYWHDDADLSVWTEAEPPDRMPPCVGVRRGSTKPCGNWERIRRFAG